MARDEAKVRVRLDTGQAKSDLRGLVREAQNSSGRVAAGVRNALGRGFRAIGLGAGIGTGLAAVRGATQSGFGDVIGEAFGGFGANLAEFFLGDLDDKARAARAAREETIQAFGTITGITGSVPPGARAFFDSVRTLRLQEEEGRGIIERDERFRGPGIGEFVDRIMAKVGEIIAQAVDALAEKLNPVNWVK